MYINNRKLEEINESDLKHLIDEEIIELKTLEYKEKLPSNTDSDKKKFLATISSFANANGGDVIFGIKENPEIGAPLGPLEGLNISNPDEEKTRLDNILRDGLEPNIPSSSLSIWPLKLKNSNYIFIIRVKRSWLKPHRISFKATHRFYGRSSSGKYLLDIPELKSLFLLSESIGEKIKTFRENRISDIFANELPIPFYDSPKIVLHLISPISFYSGQIYDLTKISLYDIKPFGSSNFNDRYNIDGRVTYSIFPNKERAYSYVQLYRNGIIEAVNSYLLWPKTEKKTIPITGIEIRLIEYLPAYMEIFKKFNIDPPIFLFLTFTGVKGYRIPENARWWDDETFPIDRDIVLIPELLIENYEFEPAQLLKPVFDSIWNACGYVGSPNYSSDGLWDHNR